MKDLDLRISNSFQISKLFSTTSILKGGLSAPFFWLKFGGLSSIADSVELSRHVELQGIATSVGWDDQSQDEYF